MITGGTYVDELTIRKTWNIYNVDITQVSSLAHEV